jgi:hypothetical protein
MGSSSRAIWFGIFIGSAIGGLVPELSGLHCSLERRGSMFSVPERLRAAAVAVGAAGLLFSMQAAQRPRFRRPE